MDDRNRGPEGPGGLGGGTATATAEAARNVADEGKTHVVELKDETKEKVAELAEDARQRAATVAQEARHTLVAAASQQEDRAVELARKRTDELRALSRGQIDEAGVVGEYAGRLADGLERLVEDFASRGVGGVAGDIERFARRRPVAFLGGMAVAGFLVGRVLRNAAAEAGSRPETSPYRGPATDPGARAYPGTGGSGFVGTPAPPPAYVGTPPTPPTYAPTPPPSPTYAPAPPTPPPTYAPTPPPPPAYVRTQASTPGTEHEGLYGG